VKRERISDLIRGTSSIRFSSPDKGRIGGVCGIESRKNFTVRDDTQSVNMKRPT
jgi:hypothetical protein